MQADLPLKKAIPQGILSVAFILYAILGDHRFVVFLLDALTFGALKRIKNASKDRIVIDDQGCELRVAGSSTPKWHIRWQEISEIVAWKIDAGTYDIICLGIRLGKDPDYCRCDEEQQGFEELRLRLQQHFGIGSQWWAQVAFPAFAENGTVLWDERNGSQFPVAS